MSKYIAFSSTILLVNLLTALLLFEGCGHYRTPKRQLAQDGQIEREMMVDIVFDLDWTLLFPLSSTEGIPSEKIIAFKSQHYRVADWAAEICYKNFEKKISSSDHFCFHPKL